MANISFNIPTKVHSEPFHCYRYDVMFNLRILSQPAAPLGQMSYLQDDIQSPNYSMASLDDGRRKRDHSELRASQIPSSEDESMTPYEVAPQTMDPLPFDSNPAFPFPNSQSIGSTNIPYQSGKSHLSMDCSVDILHLYSATLKEVKARFHSRSRTHRSLSSL